MNFKATHALACTVLDALEDDSETYAAHFAHLARLDAKFRAVRRNVGDVPPPPARPARRPRCTAPVPPPRYLR